MKTNLGAIKYKLVWGFAMIVQIRTCDTENIRNNYTGWRRLINERIYILGCIYQ